MYFPGYRPQGEPPLGESPMPSDKKVQIEVPCGKKFDWDEASWHYLTCEACDLIHKLRHFRDPVG